MIMLNVQSSSTNSFDIICADDATIMSPMFEKLSNSQLKARKKIHGFVYVLSCVVLKWKRQVAQRQVAQTTH